MRVLLVYPNQTFVGVVPSNLAILSACLKQAGHEVLLFDCSLYKTQGETQDNLRAKLGQVKKSKIDDFIKPIDKDIFNEFAKVVGEWSPGLIGFSVVDSTIAYSYELIKKLDTKPKVVFGGVGATFNCDKILKSGLVDFVCLGEGEEALVELVDSLSCGKSCDKILNICLRGPDGVIKNRKRSLADLNKLPVPDFSIYDDSRFYRPFMGQVVRMVQIDLDRGCPFSCAYCAAPALKDSAKTDACGNYYRVKNQDKIFAEIKALVKKYNINFLWISSETFLFVSLEKFKAFAKRYIEEVGIPFWCQNRLDMFSEEKTALLEEMGCKAVSVGLEHGSERIRKELLNKDISNEAILESMKVLAGHNIVPTVNSMIGLPDETRADVFETVELNRQIREILNGKQTLNVFTFIPFAGTKLRERCIKSGYISDDACIPFSFQGESMLNMPSMSKQEIMGLEKTLTLYITMPKERWPEINLAEQDDEAFALLIGA